MIPPYNPTGDDPLTVDHIREFQNKLPKHLRHMHVDFLLERVDQLISELGRTRQELNDWINRHAKQTLTIGALEERVETAEAALARSRTVDDGFGSSWPPCPKHHIALQVVRPGDARCPWCETEAALAEAQVELERTRQERDDFIETAKNAEASKNNAIKAYEKAEAALAESHLGWTRITDDPGTLPDWDGIKNYEHVRVYGSSIEIRCRRADAYMYNQCDAIFDGANFWANDRVITDLVTHWRELPAPPEEKE